MLTILPDRMRKRSKYKGGHVHATRGALMGEKTIVLCPIACLSCCPGLRSLKHCLEYSPNDRHAFVVKDQCNDSFP